MRDIVPKDFYFIQILRNSDPDDPSIPAKIISRLILNAEDLEGLTANQTRYLFNWALENLVSQKIMTVESWLTSAFHLCKQRWDHTIDWLESQPVPKVLLMIEILNDYVKAQEAEMKKAARKK